MLTSIAVELLLWLVKVLLCHVASGGYAARTRGSDQAPALYRTLRLSPVPPCTAPGTYAVRGPRAVSSCGRGSGLTA